MLVSLLLAATIAQPPPVPGKVPPPVVPGYRQPEELSDYQKAYNKAFDQDKPLVRFVNCKVREVHGCVSVYVADYNDDDNPRLILSKVPAIRGTTIDYRASDSVIRRAAGLEVAAAPPFVRPDAPRVAEGSPWLSEEETNKLLTTLRQLDVPAANSLKFYKCDPVYQNMYTMNNGRSRLNDITPVDDVDPWKVSGGMHHIDRKLWHNVTGLDLPGRISLWQEDTDVRAFALVPKWRWSFPRGTLAYDVLLAVKDGQEHVFEVRVHEKLVDSWDDGTVYRPRVNDSGQETYRWKWGFNNVGLNASALTYTTRIDRSAKFVPTKRLHVDDDFTPKNYAGAGMSCNSCHSKVGELYDVPGRIYRESRRGDDGRFSWHPFKDGVVDDRWPLERK